MLAFDEITPNEGFLSVILSAIPSGVFVTDSDQNILLINKAAAALAGRTQGDCFDRKCYDVFHTVVCKTESCICRLAREKNALQQGIYLMAQGGRDIPIEYASQPIHNIEGKIIGCVSHIRDISDRLAKERTITEQHEQVLKLLEEKSCQNQALDRANRELLLLSRQLESLAQERTVTEMALHIADQIRNPVTAIGGLVSLLQKEWPETAAQCKKFQAIVKETRELEERVRNFEKLSGQRKRRFERRNLSDLINESIQTWFGLLTKKQVSFKVTAPDEPVLATVNPATLKIAVHKLLEFAVDASPDKGTVEVRIAMVEGQPVIAVHHQGMGFSRRQFSELRKAAQTAELDSVGRGLLLVDQILREHQGRFDVQRTRSRGSAYLLHLPRHWEGKGFGKKRRPAAPSCRKLH
ncbi:MAG: PAS domain-containing protein [Thermodesulfobacteriota bacterium]